MAMIVPLPFQQIDVAGAGGAGGDGGVTVPLGGMVPSERVAVIVVHCPIGTSFITSKDEFIVKSIYVVVVVVVVAAVVVVVIAISSSTTGVNRTSTSSSSRLLLILLGRRRIAAHRRNRGTVISFDPILIPTSSDDPVLEFTNQFDRCIIRNIIIIIIIIITIITIIIITIGIRIGRWNI
jgi:hypothetical protein